MCRLRGSWVQCISVWEFIDATHFKCNSIRKPFVTISWSIVASSQLVVPTARPRWHEFPSWNRGCSGACSIYCFVYFVPRANWPLVTWRPTPIKLSFIVIVQQLQYNITTEKQLCCRIEFNNNELLNFVNEYQKHYSIECNNWIT